MVGALGLAALVYLSLTPLPHHVVHVAEGDKLEHIAAFACIQLWFSQLYSAPSHRRLLLVVFLTLALGLEVGQRLIGGYPQLEWGDVLASWGGLLLAAWAVKVTPIGSSLMWLQRTLLRCRST